MGEKESISGMGWGGMCRRLRSFTGDRGVGVARWSKIEARTSPGKPPAHTPPKASSKPIINPHNPTSEIMSDELLSNYSN